MKLSVIIPAYKDLPAVLIALNSLQALADTPSHHDSQWSGIEYIVQDDDPSVPIGLEAYISSSVASTQRNAVNLGFGGNCNAGASRASGDILLFFNQDCYAVFGMSEHWDTELLKAFENPQVGIVGFKLLFPNGHIQHAGIHFDARSQPTHRFLGYKDASYAPANISEEIPAVTGAVIAVRRSVFEELNGFDVETYRMGYFEDIDLCARARVAGYITWYQPTVQFVHVVGTSGGNPNFHYNAMQFKKRWVDSGYIEADLTRTVERFW